MLFAFRSNYFVNFANAPMVTLGSGATVITNLYLTNATSTISGKVVDANNTSIGLPGVMVHPQSTKGLMGVGFTDTNGNFTVGVQTGQWKFKPDDTTFISHGYLGMQTNIVASAGATGITIPNCPISVPNGAKSVFSAFSAFSGRQ